MNISILGYERTTMKKIAEDCNIKSASIYYFFKNKEDLFSEVLDQVLNHHFDSMSKSYFKNENHEIVVILENLLEEIAVHHQKFEEETHAYLQLLESPNTIHKKKVESHLNNYNEWLYKQLYNRMKSSIFLFSEQDIDKVLNSFLLIGNGIFWGKIIYSPHRMEKEILNAKFIIRTIYNYIKEGNHHE